MWLSTELRRTAEVSAIAAFFYVTIACKAIAELRAEQPVTVHVGDLAAIRLDSDRHYDLGSAGDSLKLIRRAEERRTTIYVYRAVAPGHHTFVLTPRDPGPDGCISCVTVHYFITVVR
jgi:hypothetical protein